MTDRPDLRQQLDDVQQKLSKRERQLEQRNRDVERLYRWLKQMDNGLSLLLNSRKWKFLSTIERLSNRALRKSDGPSPPENLVRARQRFRTWRENYEKTRSEAEAPGGPVEQQSLPYGAGSGAPSPTETRSTSSERQGFGSSEHVLEALRHLEPVTILVPVHNAYEDLEKCLESLVRNTTAPAKLLLIDDASTDQRITKLLEKYSALESASVLKNEENLGFVETVNRGFSESSGNVVLLNSDVEVTPRWLENLTLAAHADPRTATVTAVSDNAGAFSMPKIGKKNDVPAGLNKDDVSRLVMQHSGQVYPQSPTGNGFCMYIKRAALEDIGPFDVENFPRGYGEENDFCMRALKRGWHNVVDDATFVFHRGTASFGETKTRLYEQAESKLAELHPEYTQLSRAFVGSEDMKRVGSNVREAYVSIEAGQRQVRPRALFVLQQAGGGTAHTNQDLIEGLSDRYEPYVLSSNARQLMLYRLEDNGLKLLSERSLRSPLLPVEFSRADYREAVFDLLTEYRFELIHIQHLVGHTFDLPEIAATLHVPVVLSFHDFYFSCPTMHLLDDRGEYCGGICTPGGGQQCTILAPRLKNLPILKHAWLHTWRQHVREMFDHVDAFVTNSQAAKEAYLRSLPVLDECRFEVIEHGRDLEQAHCASPPGDGPIRVLIPGNVDFHKGAGFIRTLKHADRENRIELHFLGDAPEDLRDLGVFHGGYERNEFNDRVREIAPSFMGIFSIWPETYCHTLTEAWAAGVPVFASDIGTLRERVREHGGGWLLNHEDPESAYRRILEIATDREGYERELERADQRGIRSTREMAAAYENLYDTVVGERQELRLDGV